MPPLANVRIRAAIKLGLPISEIDHLLDNLGAQRIAIVNTIQRGYMAWGATSYITLEQKLKDDDTYAVVVSFGFGHNALICRTAEQADKVARRIVAGANVTESAESRLVGTVDFRADQTTNLYRLVTTAGFEPKPVPPVQPAGFALCDDDSAPAKLLDDYLAKHNQFAVVIDNGWSYVAAIGDDRNALEKFARKLSKQTVTEALKSDVTDLGTVETDKTITADKGGLRNYLRGKFNVLGINREVFSNYHHSYGGSAHDGEYYLPNSDAHGPLTSLADRLVTQRVFGPGTKSSDLAIVRFVHREAAYSLDIRYVIGFKPAVEKLIRSVRSDAAKLEALPDPGKL